MYRYFFVVFFLSQTVLVACTLQIQAEYLGFFIQNNPIPIPLVTSALLDDPIPGAIGQPHTQVLLGNEAISMGYLQGFEILGKSRFKPEFGIEVLYFFMPEVKKNRSVTTSGVPSSPNLATPVIDVSGVFGLNGVSGETIFVLPGPLEGSPFFSGIFNLKVSTFLSGGEIKGLISFQSKPHYALEWLCGLKWLLLEESLFFKVNTTTVPTTPFSFNSSQFSDHFQVRNHFLAPLFGLKGYLNWGFWHLEGSLKGSFGATFEQEKIQGKSQTITGTVWFTTSGTSGKTLQGGIFAQKTNQGVHHKIPFAASVETQLSQSFEITKNFAFDIGYTFLWISKVLRPGNQMNRSINSTRTALAEASRETTGIGTGPIPFGTPSSAPLPTGKIAPHVNFRQSSVWIQGLNVGIKLKF